MLHLTTVRDALLAIVDQIPNNALMGRWFDVAVDGGTD